MKKFNFIFFWKIPYILINKKLITAIILLSLFLLYLNKSLLNENIYLSFYFISAWTITTTYFLFKLVYLSGINQYLFYSKILGVFSIFCWVKIIIILSDDPHLLKISPYILKIPLFIFYIYLLKKIKKYKINVDRLEPWAATIYYLSIPIFLITVYDFFIPNKSTILIDEILLFYIYFIAFYHTSSVLIIEYCRLGQLQEDMEKRNLELYQFSEKAKESVRIKGEFLANMSHELRTPLNGILGSATLLIGTKLDQVQRNYLETLRICGNNLLVIINEILDYSKIEANKLELEHIPFEINACIENVFELLAPAAAAQNTELIYSIDYNVPEQTIGDYTRVQQVLTHLVDNAIKFTKNGYTFVKVTMENNTNNKDLIKFEVQDTGSGISKRDLNKLFKSFSQIDDSSTRKYGGTGLGLSIAKRLTELMGGQIGVESEIGKGSNFKFSILTDTFNDSNHDIEKNRDIKEKKMHILNKIVFILEKNTIQLESLKNCCELWSMETYTANTVEEFLNISCHEAPNFVIISTDDYDYSNLINQVSQKYLNQKIIYLALLKNSNTYYSDEKYLPQGFTTAISKPIRYSQLFESFIDSINSTQRGSGTNVKQEQQILANLFPLRILVAEDNVVNQKLVTNMLKKFGYLCDIVANGNEVLESLTRNQYDIILMDVQMPELDGIEATKKICIKYPKSTERPHIIAMTAHARGAEGQICLDAGMEGYLSKPIDLKELKQILEFWGNKVTKIKNTA